MSLLRAHGQRIFVELPDGYALLDVPSAYEMAPNGCRWIYKHPNGLIEVRSWACVERHQLCLAIAIRAGAPCRFLLSHHIALHGDDGGEDDQKPEPRQQRRHGHLFPETHFS